jgi:hypothetical protein
MSLALPFGLPFVRFKVQNIKKKYDTEEMACNTIGVHMSMSAAAAAGAGLVMYHFHEYVTNRSTLLLLILVPFDCVLWRAKQCPIP